MKLKMKTDNVKHHLQRIVNIVTLGFATAGWRDLDGFAMSWTIKIVPTCTWHSVANTTKSMKKIDNVDQHAYVAHSSGVTS